MDMSILAPMLSVAVIFLIIMTRMWQSSISTVIHGVSASLAVYLAPICGHAVGLGILFIGIFINMIRAVVNTEKDRVIKRSVPCPDSVMVKMPKLHDYGDDEHTTLIRG